MSLMMRMPKVAIASDERKPDFKVGQRVVFKNPEFEDDKVHTVKEIYTETINGHPWRFKITLENGLKMPESHFKPAD